MRDGGFIWKNSSRYSVFCYGLNLNSGSLGMNFYLAIANVHIAAHMEQYLLILDKSQHCVNEATLGGVMGVK